MSLFNCLFGPTTQQLREVKQDGTLVHICQHRTTLVGIYSVCRRWVEVVVDRRTRNIIRIQQIDARRLVQYLPEHFLAQLREKLG